MLKLRDLPDINEIQKRTRILKISALKMEIANMEEYKNIRFCIKLHSYLFKMYIFNFF